MATEQEILQAIEDNNQLREKAKRQMETHKRALLDAESLLIECNITRDRLKEQLRVCKARTVSYAMTDREKDIEAFKSRQEELYKKFPLLKKN